MKVYSHSLQGKRPTQEDQHIININPNIKNSSQILNNINLIGVFDGHGGKTVSYYLKKNLSQFYFIKSNYNHNIFLKTYLFKRYTEHIFDILQNELKETHPRASEYCGSTACIAIHTPDNILWVVNVGDSRAVLCDKNGNAKQLSIDHKPNVPDEKKRIESLGGKIVFDGNDWRIKSLSLSRAFGDLDCTPYVTHVPDIFKYKINSDDKFIIIACDGLWDVLNNQVAVDYVKNLLLKNIKVNYAEKLASYALAKGSTDNITVVVYFFL
jgi:serine/threonine protein phosphatase PrpC